MGYGRVKGLKREKRMERKKGRMGEREREKDRAVSHH